MKMLQKRFSHRIYQTFRYFSSKEPSSRIVLDSITSSSSTFQQQQQQQQELEQSNSNKLPTFATNNNLDKFNLLPNTSNITITGYIDPGFMINNVRVFGSLIVHPKQVFLWNVKSFEELTIDSLKLLEYLSPTPDLLIIGTGKYHEKIPIEFIRHFMERGIQIDFMKTVLFIIENKCFFLNKLMLCKKTSAISTFNVLNQEGRNVVCAAISLEPVDPRTITPDENPALFMQLQDTSQEFK